MRGFIGTKDDSGWIDLTPTAAGGTGLCRYRTLLGGRLVEIAMNTTGANVPNGPASPTTVIAAADMPVDIRPVGATVYGRGSTTGNAGLDIIVNTSGSVVIANPTGATSTTIRFAFVYMPG